MWVGVRYKKKVWEIEGIFFLIFLQKEKKKKEYEVFEVFSEYLL